MMRVTIAAMGVALVRMTSMRALEWMSEVFGRGDVLEILSVVINNDRLESTGASRRW
jgi:hypothetical protein